MSNNPYNVNWAALSVFPKDQVVCASCGHNYVSRTKKTVNELVAETPCPMCGKVEVEDDA